MMINPNPSVSSNPQVTSGRKNRETENQPTDGFQRSQDVRGPRDPREAGRSHGKSHDYRANNPQFRHGSASGSIAGASAGGHIAGLSSAQLHYPDGRWNITALAKKAVQEKNLNTDFPAAVMAEVNAIAGPATVAPEKLLTLEAADKMSNAELAEATKNGFVVDLRSFPSCSVDNGDDNNVVSSKDLDQAATSFRNADGSTRILIEIPDVDGLVPKGSAIDKHALGDIKEIVSWHKKAEAEAAKSDKGDGRPPAGGSKVPTVGGNSFSVYTPGAIYPMLPERLSTDLTSVNEAVDRVVLVADYTVGTDGAQGNERVYRGYVQNNATMAYPGIAKWLDPDGDGKITAERGPVPGYLADAPADRNIPGQIEMQAEAAQAMKKHREENGSLRFADMETQAKLDAAGNIEDIEVHHATVSTQLIENEMVAANGTISRHLREAGFPTLQRVVKDPEKWDKIVEFAGTKGGELPENPDSKSLRDFMNASKDREDFLEISSTIVRLMGRGEYMAVAPGETPEGHFAMAVDDYSHFTAPNRRGPDIVTHRMLKASMAGEECPYTMEELTALAAHFTAKEGDIKKAERQIEKSVNAAWLDNNKDSIPDKFSGRISGQNPKGTWVRAEVPDPDPTKGVKRIEGFLKNAGDAKLGDKVNIELGNVDVEKGRIDFKRVQ